LLGNALHGVGLPDLIRAARAAARKQLTTDNQPLLSGLFYVDQS
jgi:hypothetical protein